MSSNTNATSSSSAAASSTFRGFADFAKHTDFATSSGSTAAAALLAARRKAAAASSSSSNTASPSSSVNVATASSAGQQQQNQQLRPSPIYTGNDARLSLLFRKISQKRNPTTKVRALEELISEVYPLTITTATTTTTTTPSLTTSSSVAGASAAATDAVAVVGETSSSNTTSPTTTTTSSSAYSRPDKIASLSHLLYLHETKLGYDNNPSVRALSYQALVCARHHVPKAWNALFLGSGGGGTAVAISSIGMAWGAMQGDPASEVSRNASLFMEELLHAEKGEEQETNAPLIRDATTTTVNSRQPNKILVPGTKIQVAICQYSKMVLSCKRPSTLQEFILNFNTALSSSSSALSGPFSSSFGMVTGSSSMAASSSGGAKGKKSKNFSYAHCSSSGETADASTTTTSAELEKEEMAERYERVMLSVLFGLGWLFECCGQGQITSDEAAKKDIYHHASTVLFPDSATSILRLLSSSRGSFRRGTYMLLGQICQFAPMLLSTSSSSQLPSSLSMGSLLPNLLSSEKDPSNFVSLLEMILSYLAAAQGGMIGDNIVGAFRVGDHHSGKQEDVILLDPVSFTTALSKALRRGCYGAAAGAWGPTILPFVASLPAFHHHSDGSGGEELRGRIEGEQPQDTKLSQSPSALPLQLTILSSLWEGRKSAAGVTDTISIVSAVAECATFLMLRRSNHQRPINFTAQSWRLCGELFLNALSYYLMEAPDKAEAYGPVASAVDGLCSTLARDLNKLDASSLSSVSSSSTFGTDNICVGLSTVQSWFWGQDGIERTLFQEEGRGQQQRNIICRKWDLLLKSLLSLNDGSKQLSASHLIPACKKLFHTIANNNRPCNDIEGRLLLTILQFGQVDNIFSSCTTSAEEIVDDDGISTSASIERFCVNDLLRWILVHASTDPNTVKIDFDIFQLCMHSIPSVICQKQIWVTILRELIKSFCDYTALAIGLETLASNEATRNFVRCQVLDTFAIGTAKSLMNEFRLSHVILHHHDELDIEKQSSARSGDVSRFLQSCVGTSKEDLSGSRSVIIVSDSVIRHWVDLCCERDDDGATKLEENLLLEDESGNNILLKTMLDLSSHNEIVISRDEAVKLMSESWFEGGKTWYGYAVKCLNSDEALRDQVISIAENSLSEDIHSAPPNDDKLLDLICHSWANRAARLFGIHPAGGLASIGIGDIDLWERAALAKGNDAEFLFLCLMYLLDSIGSDNSRRDVLMTNIDVFVHIQAAITKCDADLESFHQRTDRSRQLVDILGGSDMLSRSFLEDSCIHTADLLATYMNSDFASKKLLMMRGLTSLSYLVSILFPFAYESHSSDVNPIDVKEGDTVWYERGEHGKRVNATVVKVHTDDFPKLYFTIKEDGAEGERQTVASRLRWTNEEIIENNLPEKDDSAQRDRVGRYIVDKLVRPFLTEHRCDDNDDDDSRTIREFSAESMNIVVSQCGFVSLGIGSVRYDIFQAAHSMVEDLCDVLSPSGDGPYLETSTSVLRSLALAMGYGFYTIPAQNSVSHLKLDTTESMLQLLQLYENESWLEAQRKDPLNSFHSSVLMWLAVVVGTATEGELLGRIARVIFSCSDLILFDGSCNVAIDSISVMNAMSSLISSIDRCINCSSANDERESRVLSKLTQTFIDLSPHRGPWIETFASLLQKKCNRSRSTLIPAATAFSHGLCDCLFVPTKRWCAFQLLNILANEPHPLRPGDDVIIPPNIDQHLSDWKKELDEEEAIDLEEDVLIAASWLPENMMTLFLNVGDNSSTEDSEHDMQVVSIGNLLAWVVSLDIVEVAGSVDMRNRAHISSFIQKSNALGFIMNLALQEADLNVSRGANIFDCIAFDLEGRSLLQKIATLALFRSVESLPTMVKTWYNDDCPRFLQQNLSSFVESVVAPTTLQRELARIKDATSLGEMSVSGSCVSREVVATYQQDECQLSVMIRMPPTFPLRNVEVDCKKTMGIPESRWRRWALQIMLMLNNQDGSVLDALLLWKQNVDKEFDGVEPCPVCYSVLCIKTHQMPNLECKTCHNRFHTTCLMKWFQSSGKSSCVLCQQPWSGAKV